MHVMRKLLLSLFVAGAVVTAPFAELRAEPVKVFAAASLKNALDEVGAAWSKADAAKRSPPPMPPPPPSPSRSSKARPPMSSFPPISTG